MKFGTSVWSEFMWFMQRHSQQIISQKCSGYHFKVCLVMLNVRETVYISLKNQMNEYIRSVVFWTTKLGKCFLKSCMPMKIDWQNSVHHKLKQVHRAFEKVWLNSAKSLPILRSYSINDFQNKTILLLTSTKFAFSVGNCFFVHRQFQKQWNILHPKKCSITIL